MTAVIIAVIAFAIGADQVTKALLTKGAMRFIPGFIRFEPVRNEGMAWGLMHGVNWFVPVVSVVTAIVIVVFGWLLFKNRRKMHPAISLGFAMVIGGAAGNLIDRIALGYVRDFICTEFISFPVFNVADIFVTVGALLLGFMFIFTKSGHALLASVFPDDKPKGGEAE